METSTSPARYLGSYRLAVKRRSPAERILPIQCLLNTRTNRVCGFDAMLEGFTEGLAACDAEIDTLDDMAPIPADAD
jgi:hypothetical protein